MKILNKLSRREMKTIMAVAKNTFAATEMKNA